MENGRQSELAIDLTSITATPEPGNHCSEGSKAHGGSTGEFGMVGAGNTRQESIDASSTRNLLASSCESSVSVDFELLWRLRKYLVLLGILAVGVTYNAGLTPPGGFWTKKKDGHDAGDPILLSQFFLRHEVFFYCNATAFAASLVLIILLLSKHVTRQKLWLRSMQFTMILDLFSLMGAYAAGSCRAVKSSIYIWVLVVAVFIYILIHILVFIRVVPKWLKEKAQSILRQIPHKWVVHKDRRSSPQEEDVDEARKFMLMLVTFAATVTYQAGLSPPGGFWSENKENQHPATSMLRSKNLARYNIFVSCNSTSFVASLVTIILLLSPELSRHGIRSKAVNVCIVADLLGLMGAYAAGSCRSVAQSFLVMFIAIVVWIFIALLAGSFVLKPVANCLRNIKLSCMDKVGRVFSLEYGRNRSRNAVEENSFSSHQQTVVCVTDAIEQASALEPEHQSEHHQQVPNVKEGEPNWLRRNAVEETSFSSHQQTVVRVTDATEQESALEPQHQSEHHQQVPNAKKGESHREHQFTGKQQTATTEEDKSGTEHTLANDQQSENTKDALYNLEGQSTNHQLVAKEALSKTEIQKAADTKKQFSSMDDLKTSNPTSSMPNPGHQSADNQKIANMIGQSSSTDDHKPTVMPVEEFPKDIVLASDHNGTTNNLTVGKESSNVLSETSEIEIARIHDDTRPYGNGYTDRYEGAPSQADNKENASGNPTDKHLKKSRTYLLLLAILAVSLTYQSGLNPPGGFWSNRENNNLTGDPIIKDTHHRLYHLPADPVLEDSHHQRYIAFFYLNAIAFVASIVMIVMLLNRRMSNKVIKRYALQIAMIVDLLSLTGSYLMGSCRKTKNSIYILLLFCLVFAYVAVHVLIAIHVIPEWCKQLVAEKLGHLSCKYIWPKLPQLGHDQGGEFNEKDEINKNWEQRRNLLLMLAVLAATVTYQAGMNPPAGVWSDDKDVNGKPGDPILQHNNLKRYDVFYYSNSVSFVSSVAITILLVNKESCEHGIKSYALRVCLVVGLVGLLVAYAAGSCRKAKQSIYLIIIAVAVLISIVIQVFLLSSTHNRLGGPFGKCMKCLLEWLCGMTEARQENTIKKQEISGHHAKKVRKRHKYLVLLAILAASITYQAGLNPPGGFWSDDDEGHVAGNPVLLDIHPRRYKTFFWLNSISFMASIVMIMYLLNKSIWKMDVPLEVLHLVMILDLLALMTAFAAGSCRKFRTSVYVYGLVVCVVIYLVIVIFLSTSIAKRLRPGERSGIPSCRRTNGASGTEPLIPEH